MKNYYYINKKTLQIETTTNDSNIDKFQKKLQIQSDFLSILFLFLTFFYLILIIIIFTNLKTCSIIFIFSFNLISKFDYIKKNLKICPFFVFLKNNFILNLISILIAFLYFLSIIFLHPTYLMDLNLALNKDYSDLPAHEKIVPELNFKVNSPFEEPVSKFRLVSEKFYICPALPLDVQPIIEPLNIYYNQLEKVYFKSYISIYHSPEAQLAFSKSQVGHTHSFGVLDRVLNTPNNNIFDFRSFLSNLRCNDQLALNEFVKFNLRFTPSTEYIFYSESKLFVNKQSNIFMQEIAHKRIDWFNSIETQDQLKIKIPIENQRELLKTYENHVFNKFLKLGFKFEKNAQILESYKDK